MVNDNTRLDKITVGPGARLTRNLTFTTHSSTEVNLNWIIANIRPLLKNEICSSSEPKLALQYGGVFAHLYWGNDGVYIGGFEFDRNDCGYPRIGP